MYGYQNSEDVGPGKAGGKFGLNSGVFATKFEFNANAGKEGAALEAIDFIVQIEEREYRKRFFPIERAFKNGQEITDKTSADFKKEQEKENKLLTAALSDIVSCFVSEDTLKEALAVPIASFKDYAEILQRLVHSVPNWEEIPIDLFLQYQYNIKGENNRTFLEIPGSVKHGKYVIKTQGEGFEEERTPTHLKYFNEERVEHPFKRNTWYVNNGFSKLTELNNSSETPVEGAGDSW